MNWIVPLAVAFLAGVVAVRNAGKTPYDQLEQLVGIAKDLPADADPNGVLVEEMDRQIRRIKERSQARQRGIVPYFVLWIREPAGLAQWLISRLFLLGVLGLLVAPVAGIIWLIFSR
ncbi:hypothetical protein [Nocardia abscessus]|uniref:hypothetical protein n=1 Tax=Nocardia abscessus TaxID=120957 RepID=UPI002454DF06|nr:hypothetical protein [Nocardia abscessus]